MLRIWEEHCGKIRDAFNYMIIQHHHDSGVLNRVQYHHHPPLSSSTKLTTVGKFVYSFHV